MHNKKVLILTDVFPPGFAPRMGYLCKYLKDYNWDAIALAPLYDRENNVFNFLSNNIPYECIKISKEAEIKEYTRSIFRKGLSIFFPNELISVKLRKETYIKGYNIITGNKIETILCSTSNIYPLSIACKLAKENNISWVADLRDIEEEYIIKGNFLKKIARRFLIKKRNSILKRASALIVVSQQHEAVLTKINPNTNLIYNGFDSDLFFYTSPQKSKLFKIVYTGTISTTGVKRDPSMLFEAVQTLDKENKINPNFLRIQFYADLKSHDIVKKLAVKYEVAGYIDCFGYIPSVEIPVVLHDASILLLLIEGKHGIMTTKLFEYLAVGRTILCVRSDEDAVEATIHELNAGLAARTNCDVYSFVESKYNEWKIVGYVQPTTKIEVTKKYSRYVQAGEFVQVLDANYKSHNK